MPGLLRRLGGYRSDSSAAVARCADVGTPVPDLWRDVLHLLTDARDLFASCYVVAGMTRPSPFLYTLLQQ
ncbi:hypothetical protein E2C01_011643 [Portunus trituberculatus]|uniref:Uncharacterized protein n=1 Tax=Portunus trituberculatus TaxID=210409 RepID=A0A5B7DBW3_PORTR|nr:hypothetical protein [Portunus trituberculatus]